jgi:malonyl-CoA O-methyltransferase
MSSDTQNLNKALVRRSFSKAASTYEASAELQKQVFAEMLERLEFIRLEPRRILDVGCGTGVAMRELERRYRKAQVLGIDFAEGMLSEARSSARFWRRPMLAAGDLESLPVRSDTMDLMFSSLTLQWCSDLGGAFTEAARVLRSGGLFFFSTLGPDTLKELRHCWAQVDGLPHVNQFVDMHHVGDALVSSGFADVVMDVERVVLHYDSVRDLVDSLREVGAVNHIAGRRDGLMGKSRWQAMVRAYEELRDERGRFPLSYEVVYGHALRPAVVSGDSEGVVKIPLSGLKLSK